MYHSDEKERLRLPPWLLVTLLFSAIGAVAIGYAAYRLGGFGEAPDSPVADLGPRDMSTLFPGKYRRLAFCVQAVNGTLADALYVRRRLRTALATFRGPRPFYTGLPRNVEYPPLIDIGCPTPPARLTTGGGIPVADQPGASLPASSPYHLHVFVLSPARRETIFPPGSRYPWADAVTEEFDGRGLGGDVMFVLTQGLYMTVGDFADLTDVEDFFERRWSLERIVPLPTPAVQLCVTLFSPPFITVSTPIPTPGSQPAPTPGFSPPGPPICPTPSPSP